MSKWIYGYYNDDNEFVAIDALDKSQRAWEGWKYVVGVPIITAYIRGVEDLHHDAATRGNKRYVFLNTETGQSLPYADQNKGQPGTSKKQADNGRYAILEFLNNGKRVSRGNTYLKKFIEYNGGEEVWSEYNAYTGRVPVGVPKGNLTAGVPQDSEGNYLNPVTGEYLPLDDYLIQVHKINKDGTYAGDDTESDGENPHEDALNEYYKDLYSLKKGTSGDEMYRRLTDVYANQATVAGSIAEAQYQQQAMQQAHVVKQIADQVRNERMARLRAGMSEAQIANQDMQTLMTNVQALNANAAQLNQARLEATGAYLTAQDQAYMDYLNQSNARGQVAMAGAAADAGNAYFLAQRYMANNPGTSFATAYKIVTGQQQQNK